MLYIQRIKYQSKHNSLLHKIQFRATCFDSLLSHLQGLKNRSKVIKVYSALCKVHWMDFRLRNVIYTKNQISVKTQQFIT